MNRFASRWLRRDYDAIDRVFDGKVKGRILLDRYVETHLAIGQAMRIPCRTVERTQDTPNNRILKAGLRYVATLSHTLPVPAARRAVLQQVAAALPKFAQVSDIEPGPADLRATSARGPQRHYAPILHSTMTLLSNKFITNQFGDHSTQSFMWQMPWLFQEAVRGVIDSFDDVLLDDSKPPVATVYDCNDDKLRSSRVDPDLVIRTTTGGFVLLDTKYKNAVPHVAADPDADYQIVELPTTQRIRLARADVYQAVAYRHHNRWVGSTSGLLYPVSLAVGQGLPKPFEVRGFGQPIFLVFIDIGPNARRNVRAFHHELSDLQSRRHTAPFIGLSQRGGSRRRH